VFSYPGTIAASERNAQKNNANPINAAQNAAQRNLVFPAILINQYPPSLWEPLINQRFL
jgi:hypothetical protein